jgi:predicted NAD/FAD-binding protein
VRPDDGPVALTYDMNTLQRLDAPERFLVTLNRTDAIDPSRILRRMTYYHPLYTPDSVAAQARHREIDGARATYYCGAWLRNGFHEDGVASALAAVQHFRDDLAQRTLQRSA